MLTWRHLHQQRTMAPLRLISRRCIVARGNARETLLFLSLHSGSRLSASKLCSFSIHLLRDATRYALIRLQDDGSTASLCFRFSCNNFYLLVMVVETSVHATDTMYNSIQSLHHLPCARTKLVYASTVDHSMIAFNVYINRPDADIPASLIGL